MAEYFWGHPTVGHFEEQGCSSGNFKRSFDDEATAFQTEPFANNNDNAKRWKIDESQPTTPSSAKEIHELLYNDQIPSGLVAQCSMNKCGVCLLEFTSPTRNGYIFTHRFLRHQFTLGSTLCKFFYNSACYLLIWNNAEFHIIMHMRRLVK